MRIPALLLFSSVLVSLPLTSQQAAAQSSAAPDSAARGPATVAEAQAFLDRANAELLKANTDAARAEWTAETDITDDTEAITARMNEIATARTLALAAQSHRFDRLQLPADLRRQLKLLQVTAPAAPKEPNLLAEQTQLAAELTGMYGKGKYCPDTPPGQEPAPGAPASGVKCMGIDDISAIMAKSHDPEELTKLWVGWHAIGAPMRDKYARFIALQNIGARELGYKDTGELWRANYDMTPAEFSAELEQAWTQLEPLYRALHDYVRARLISTYGKAAERPDGMIPAQLLGNMWAQEWGNIYDIVAPTDPRLAQFKPVDLELALKQQIAEKDPAAAPAFASRTDLSSDAGHAAQLAAARDMVHYGENFFKSLGFAPLPPTFWQRSQFVHPRDREVVCHASAWDVDSADDLRVKMCIDVSADYFTTVHHELGHNFYQRAYNKQPYLFRNGANDGFHEAIGDSIALSITPAYLKTLGLADSEPPAEADFDPGAKMHVPANVPYARYFLARIYQFQFFKAMCDASGYTGPLNRCTFYGSKAAGEKLNRMLEAGQSQPWQKTLQEMTGTDHLDAQPMIDYFAPLYAWLKEQNAANAK